MSKSSALTSDLEPSVAADIAEVEQLEIDLLLEAIYRRYAYDFRDYARASVTRRIRHMMSLNNYESVSALLSALIRDRAIFDQFLRIMSITVTEMYRDPSFYIALREQVIPFLETYPFVKIWHAGCATGEEVYSVAIMLEEEGFYDRCHLYATDYNNRALDAAIKGIYPIERIRLFTKNYQLAGGKSAFSDYYHAEYGAAKFSSALRRNVTFAHHNMVSDSSFGEMNLIICRNVLIYFNRNLQERVFKLFVSSLAPQGTLCLGSRESLDYSSASKQFETLSKTEKIYRKLS